ncbi:MAG TPA: ABC transporter substrate-binding protein [Firmicutes bacterium]|nr:ABC transporter substrate-binding protein [Bacillota bacterium]
MYQKLGVLVTVTLLVVVLAGAAALAAQDTLVIGAGAEAVGLDPRLETDIPSFEKLHLIMEPLVNFKVNMEYGPRLATDWDVSEDTMTLWFKLRENVFWHDGQPFTAEDVKYTFEWILEPSNAAPDMGLFEDIEQIEVVNDTEVIFRLRQPNSFLLNNIARMPIVPKHDGERADFRQSPIGTGPYKLVSWQRDDRMILVENEDYWGGRPIIPNVVFRPIPENATRLLAFEAGEIDVFQGGVVPQEIDRLEADPNFIVQRTPGTGYNFLGFNCEAGPLADVKVRQALSYIINREAIVSRVLNGIGTPGVSPVSVALPWFNPDVERFQYNPEKAKELLLEAGYEPGDIKIRLYTNENPERMRIAEILQFEAQEIGIEIEVIIEEWGAYLSRIQETDDFDIFILGWVGQLDPDRAMFRQFHSQGSQNNGNYANARVDELLERGRTVPPESQESLDIYGEAQAIIVAEAAYGFINYSEEVGLQHRWIENWHVHPYGGASWQDVHLVVKNK